MSDDEDPISSDGSVSDDSDSEMLGGGGGGEAASSAVGTTTGPLSVRGASVAAQLPKRSRPIVDHASLTRILNDHTRPAKDSDGDPNQTNDTNKNRSVLRMTKYEYARVKGVRMEQLQRGAIPCVDYGDLDRESVETVFRREFVSGRMPLMVIRELPDGKSEYFKIRDFVDRDATVYD
jgi:DNA-directed RNA polymerase subunit K/omega